jgi:hypothetical protein
MKVIGFQEVPDPNSVPYDLYRYNSLAGGGSAIVARTELVRAVGGFSPDFTDLADWDLWLRMIQVSPLAVVPKYQIAYGCDLQAPTHSSAARSIEELTRLRAKHFFGVNGHPDIDVGMWNRWLSVQYCRSGDRSAMSKIWLREAQRTHKPLDLGRAIGKRILPMDLQFLIQRGLRHRFLHGKRRVEVDAARRWLAEAQLPPLSISQ